MSNSNRFIINAENYNVTAAINEGIEASFGQEVFLASPWSEAETLLSQEGTIDLQGKTYVRENGGSWSRTIMSQTNPVTINNGSLTGMIRLAQAGNTWLNLGGGLWSIGTDNISGSVTWTDYDGNSRTTATLADTMDASRATAHLIEPERSFYDGQPAVAVYPPPPAQYKRYPTCLSETWLNLQSVDNSTPVKGSAQVDGTNKIIGLTITDTDMKTEIRQMVANLEGVSSPEQLMVIMRSGPNDIADANIETWTDAGGSNDIVITLMAESTKLKRASSGYIQILFTGDRSFITEDGQWVLERTGYDNTLTQQETCESAKTVVYRPAYSDTAPDAYYPVVSSMLDLNGGDVTFNDCKLWGACIPVNYFIDQGSAYLINKTGYYDYDFDTETHADVAWATLNRCKFGWCWFGIRGQCKMFDCFSTDVVRNSTALTDGTECRRNVFSAAYTYETMVVLGNTGNTAAANIPKRRSIVTDIIFFQEPTCHGQGLSFYNDANMNFECRHNLFLNCQRAWSMQPDTNFFWRNTGVQAPDANQVVSNNLAIFDRTMDTSAVPGQSTFASNGGSDYWLKEPPQIYIEQNTILIRPNMSDDWPAGSGETDVDLQPRWSIDMGDVGFAKVQARNNLYGVMRTRPWPPESEYGTVADIASLPADPERNDAYFVTSELGTDYPSRTWNGEQWIRMAGQQEVDTFADLASLSVDPLHIVYVVDEDTSYQIRDTTWVALAEHPYTDNTLMTRRGMYLAGNLSCTSMSDSLKSSEDIGVEGQYDEAPSTYEMIVYNDNDPVTATAAFNTAGAEGLKPGALWTNVPTPNVIRAWIEDNFSDETTDSATWYTTYPESVAFDNTVVPSRFTDAEWDTELANNPTAFLSKSSPVYDTRPAS